MQEGEPSPRQRSLVVTRLLAKVDHRPHPMHPGQRGHGAEWEAAADRETWGDPAEVEGLHPPLTPRRPADRAPASTPAHSGGSSMRRTRRTHRRPEAGWYGAA